VALGLIGKKLGMTQIFSKEGEIIPVTAIKVGPCVVVQQKTSAKEGYDALQLAFGEKKLGKVTKPLQGHFKPLNGAAYAILKEFRVAGGDAYKVGDVITSGIFEQGERVRVSGCSKGHGFTGNIKRWGFNRGPMSHGSKFHRVVGSVGASAFPSRTFKGKRMPGHRGAQQVTVRNLEIVDTNREDNVIFVHGAIPGAKNGIVTVYKMKA